jgi:NAD-dependent SIR2 family protein deacetylase
VYFDGIPRRLKEFRDSLGYADVVVVIGTQLHYAYLSEPICYWAFNHPGRILALDPREEHLLDNIDCRDRDAASYPELLADWLDIQNRVCQMEKECLN